MSETMSITPLTPAEVQEEMKRLKSVSITTGEVVTHDLPDEVGNTVRTDGYTDKEVWSGFRNDTARATGWAAMSASELDRLF